MRADSPDPAVSGASRPEHVTATGWRLVGKAAALITNPSEPRPLEPGPDDDTLFHAQLTLRPRLGGGSAAPAAIAALSAAIARHWQDAPPLTLDHPIARPAARFHGLRWQPAGERGAWRGELVWRHPHPVIAGVPCTTHLRISEHHHVVTLDTRVTADLGFASVRGTVGAGQARPAFLTDLARTARLLYGDGTGDPLPLREADIDAFVRDTLLADTRAYPAAVLSPLEDGSFVVTPAEMADELLGLAHLYVVDRHATTFRLSDSVGDRRLSCYWGALRVYMPEFSCADSPTEHPLLTRERLVDPVIRADLVGKLVRAAVARASSRSGEPARLTHLTEVSADQSPPTTGIPPTPSPSTTTAALLEADAADARPTIERAERVQVITSIPSLLDALTTQIGTLGAAIGSLVEANASLGAEIERLRTTTAVRTAGTTSLERRIVLLERLLERHLPPAPTASLTTDDVAASVAESSDDEDESETMALVDALRQAATAHADALLVLDAAERSAQDSPFEDIDRLGVVLDAMAAIARRRQSGALGTSLKEAFRDLGIDYRGGISSGTSEKHRRQYLVHGSGDRVFDCREHVVLGTSYDPRHCLRIYFTSRAALEPRFVIGHVGRHFDVATTS